MIKTLACMVELSFAVFGIFILLLLLLAARVREEWFVSHPNAVGLIVGCTTAILSTLLWVLVR